MRSSPRRASNAVELTRSLNTTIATPAMCQLGVFSTNFTDFPWFLNLVPRVTGAPRYRTALSIDGVSFAVDQTCP